MTTYNTTLLFNLLDIVQLQTSIKLISDRFGVIIDSLTYDDGTRNLTISSSDTLTQDDIANIESVISTYTNPSISKVQRVNNITLYFKDINNTTFKTIGDYDYLFNGNYSIKELKVEGYILSGNYTVRLVDVTTNTILGYNTFSNNIVTTNIILLSTISDTIVHSLEVQVNCSDSSIPVKINKCTLILEEV